MQLQLQLHHWRGCGSAGQWLDLSLPLKHLADLLDTLTLTARQLLQHDDLHSLRECADTACGWLFLDRTKNHSRSWCSSADCGNRARARRRYNRRRPGSE